MEIKVNNLSKSFLDVERKIDVFNDLNFSVPTGSSLAIVGESGVGKTTLLYIMGGLEKPDSGEVVYNGKSLVSIDSTKDGLASFRGDNIGFVFQFHYLLPEFSAVENVAMPLIIKGFSFEEANRKATEFLHEVGLEHRLHNRPGTLSGGEQQRVQVARALIGQPGVILADEPTGNLDQKTGDEVISLMLGLQNKHGMTLVVVTHSKDISARMDSTSELTVNGLIQGNR
jgi:lipoprotein-releasing system ATP-binding protein